MFTIKESFLELIADFEFAKLTEFFIFFKAKMMQRAATSILPAAGNMLAQTQQQRGMATLKAISIRLKSVKNIQKITQSMKMVSAAKYTRAERELKQARPYGEGSKQFYDKAEIAVPNEESKKLYIAITSDRGKQSDLQHVALHLLTCL